MGVWEARTGCEALWAGADGLCDTEGHLRACPAGQAMASLGVFLPGPLYSAGQGSGHTTQGDSAAACVDFSFPFRVREWTTAVGFKPSFTWPQGVNAELVP